MCEDVGTSEKEEDPVGINWKSPCSYCEEVPSLISFESKGEYRVLCRDCLFEMFDTVLGTPNHIIQRDLRDEG